MAIFSKREINSLHKRIRYHRWPGLIRIFQTATILFALDLLFLFASAPAKQPSFDETHQWSIPLTYNYSPMPLLKFFLQWLLHIVIDTDALGVRVRDECDEHIHQDELHRGDESNEQEER